MTIRDDFTVKENAPRLLLLAFPFPPARAIGGVRCANLAKYLSRLGWQVTVVTIHPDLLADPDPTMTDMEAWFREADVMRVWTGHGLRMFLGGYLVERWWERWSVVRKAASAWVRWTGMDRGIGWIRPVMKACAHLRPGDVDIVMASGSPFASFEAAGRLGLRLRARVVLDYRDLWNMAPHHSHPLPTRIRKREQKLVNQAAHVLAVSGPMAQCLAHAFGHAEKISVITNGFDSETFRAVVPRHFDQPTVVYAGTFYPPLRVIDPVLEAIGLVNQDGLADGRQLRLLYLGPHGEAVRKAAEACAVMRWVDICGRVPRSDVYAAMKGAVAVAVITSVNRTASPEVDSILTGKLFEAMVCGAPVLLVAPEGSEAARVVTETRAGQSFVGADIEHMAAWLQQRIVGDSEAPVPDVQAYAWPEIARRVDRLLREDA
ncbi:MAG: glycosyltransferase [Kiritimatiellia bacterium]|jgi:glycosyltransferase involved in cell wall biosynthesis|nr:glycosyltransferase [Kiritimatiellia bacterium]